MDKAKAIVLLSLAGLLIIAAIVLVVTNIGNVWELHLYYRTVTLSRALVLLLTALIAIGLWALLRWMLPVGLHAARSASKISREKKLNERLEQFEHDKRQPAPRSTDDSGPAPRTLGPQDKQE